jgi:ADP-heptose:LPS heptosyltransferase
MSAADNASARSARREASRLRGRVEVVARAARERLRAPRVRPSAPARILIAHHLLLGDTLMLTPLVAKLRARYPAADIVMTVAASIAPLYATRPYGVRAIAWSPRAMPGALFAEAPFDLALVPGDNRFAWLAAAMRARWIVAFAGDSPPTKNWPIDELVPYPQEPGAWGDLVASLIEGPAPAPFVRSDWPTPPADAFAQPAGDYALLHLGASSPLKLWPTERWSALASWLAAQGIEPVWSAGRGEQALVRAVDPRGFHRSLAGALDLAQWWRLAAGARVVVAPDTGVAHLARIVGVPTVVLFGPGSATICGAGDFWRDAPYRAVTVDPFPCRDQHLLFRRDIAWVRRCARTTSQCASPRCMHAVALGAVQNAIAELGVR